MSKLVVLWATVLMGCHGSQFAHLPAETQALRDLYESASGEQWIRSDGWGGNWTTSPCTWFGILCERGTNVTRLDLTANGLAGTMPASISKLTALTNLKMSSNPLLAGTLPSSIGNMVTQCICELSLIATLARRKHWSC